jgi:hypothetical protein
MGPSLIVEVELRVVGMSGEASPLLAVVEPGSDLCSDPVVSFLNGTVLPFDAIAAMSAVESVDSCSNLDAVLELLWL